MSLLEDYEQICQEQHLELFKEVLDETLKPIVIILEERYFKINRLLDDLNIKIMDLRGEVEGRLKGMDDKIERELNYAYDTHNTKLHNIWSDVVKIQGELETIQLNLKK